MGIKKINTTECLFAVIVISFILVAVTFFTPYYTPDYKISFGYRIFSLGIFTLTTSLFLFVAMLYLKINTLLVLVNKSNLKSPLSVLIVVNCNVLFFAIGFLIDNFLHNKLWLENIEFIFLIFIVPFLVANFVTIFNVGFIDFESPSFFSISSFQYYKIFQFLYYSFWVLLFFVLCLLLVYEGYPLLGLSMLIFCLINVNLLSHSIN